MGELIGRDEAARILGVSPESVRSTLWRYGIREQRGWDRDEIEHLKRPGRGRAIDQDEVQRRRDRRG